MRIRSDVSIIMAFVVVADGAPNDAAAIKDFAAQHLAAYKIPREIVFVERLPRTPNGKIQRKALKLPSLANNAR
jgi:acyl-coenzyme A synthetase/AMP-(fatty) acid ligase